MRKYSLILGIFSLCVLILSGCGKLKRSGTALVNTPPKVYFADVPPESTYFSVNPKIYWYGTDIDGFITAFQYAVLISDSVVDLGGVQGIKDFLHGIPPDSTSWVDNIALKNMIGTHMQAEPGGTSRNVMMFADMSPEIYTPQYLFLRAIDNSGGVSEAIYRIFFRNNHRPWAIIDSDSAFRASNHYCLSDTTSTWKGISVSWTGKDSLDYPNPRIQPDFSFKWELVGPFEQAPTSLTVDTSAVVDSSLDSTFAGGNWVYSRWVSDRLHVFKGLENFGDSGYGWYQLRMRARDDAFVSTDTATTMNFRILKPKFRYADKNLNTILVVDATVYGGKDGGVIATKEVRPFYREALDSLKQQGFCDDFILWYDSPDSSAMNKRTPSEDVLSRYDLVILLNLGSFSGISNDNFGVYRDYLNIGGRLWLIGLNNFSVGGTRAGPTSLATIRSGAPYAYEVGTAYCGIEGVFVPGWSSLDSMTLEFVGAEPFGLWEGLPSLQADTAKCKLLKGDDPSKPSRQFGVRGIPNVCFETISNTEDFAYRIPAERRMFSFISYYGSISPMQDKPCALNYIGPTFRTAEFAFPLNLMKNDDHPVYEVMRRTVEWFWQDLP